MVAPKYGSPEPFSTGAAQDAASTRNDKRREEILLRLISDANEDRMEGNTLFKDRSFNDAVVKYSKAIHTLQKASASDFVWLARMRFGVVEGWADGAGFCLVGPRGGVDILEEGTFFFWLFEKLFLPPRSLARELSYDAWYCCCCCTSRRLEHNSVRVRQVPCCCCCTYIQQRSLVSIEGHVFHRGRLPAMQAHP